MMLSTTADGLPRITATSPPHGPVKVWAHQLHHKCEVPALLALTVSFTTRLYDPYSYQLTPTDYAYRTV